MCCFPFTCIFTTQTLQGLKLNTYFSRSVLNLLNHSRDDTSIHYISFSTCKYKTLRTFSYTTYVPYNYGAIYTSRSTITYLIFIITRDLSLFYFGRSVCIKAFWTSQVITSRPFLHQQFISTLFFPMMQLGLLRPLSTEIIWLVFHCKPLIF